MRNELLAWFAREGLLLQDVTTSAEDPEHDEVKITVKAPIIALSKARDDFRECPDPVLFGYPGSSLEMMTLDDFHSFVYQWFKNAAATAMGRCFVWNQDLDIGMQKPWDAASFTQAWHCWLAV